MTLSKITKSRSEARAAFVRDIDHAFQIGATLSGMAQEQLANGGEERVFYDAAHQAVKNGAQLERYLTHEERVKYGLVQGRYNLIEEERQRTLSVLEWLVFPEEAAKGLRVPKSASFVGQSAGLDLGGFNDPFDAVKDGATPSQWEDFWKKTDCYMASLPDLVQAQLYLQSIRRERHGLYTDEELEKAESMYVRIGKETYARTVRGSDEVIDGLLVDTKIKFGRKQTHGTVSHGTTLKKAHYDVLFDPLIRNMYLKDVAQRITGVSTSNNVEDTGEFHTGKQLLSALFGLDPGEYDAVMERMQKREGGHNITTITTPPLKARSKENMVHLVHNAMHCICVMMDANESTKMRYSTLGIRKDVYDRYNATTTVKQP